MLFLMAIHFREVHFPPLKDLTVSAPDGAVIGVIGESGSGKRALIRLAAGLEWPTSGEVSVRGTARLLGVEDDWDPGNAETLVIEHGLAQHDAITRYRAEIDLERLRRRGGAALILSHEEDLLLRLCDEIWWIDRGELAAKGDPSEVIDRYRHHVARHIRAEGEAKTGQLAPTLRRGDGRARILSIETLGAGCQPTTVWQSGEQAIVRVTVKFEQAVDDPVVGIMIRTRIGFEVYGTNTELENVKLGPCAAGDTLRISFAFQCNLCPQEYTITAASHDPDGVWHDWMEDAVAFAVADSRYTAGVVNLRAQATVERM